MLFNLVCRGNPSYDWVRTEEPAELLLFSVSHYSYRTGTQCDLVALNIHFDEEMICEPQEGYGNWDSG